MQKLAINPEDQPWVLAIEPWAEAHDIPAGVRVTITSHPVAGERDNWDMCLPFVDGSERVLTVGLTVGRYDLMIGETLHAADY